MSLEEKKRLIVSLDNLLRSKTPGKAEYLADRLGISRSSLFRLITYMREELYAPIVFDAVNNRYVYGQEGMVMFRFVPFNVIEKSRADKLMGAI
ncbi:MAG: hypothetical protein ABIS36_06325 [Chryseolinea sp.]